MLIPEPHVVAVLLVTGCATLAAATWLAVREPAAGRGGRARAASPLVPWLGSLAAVLLAVRGAVAAAGFVLLATIGHAAVARWRSLVARRTGR